MTLVMGQRLRDEANVVLMGKKGASKKGQRLAHRDPNGLAHNPTNLSKQYIDSSNKRFSYIVIELICPGIIQYAAISSTMNIQSWNQFVQEYQVPINLDSIYS